MSESEFVWATVTTAGTLSTLRVLIDGDPHPLPTPPHDCLTNPAALAVGDRVRCEWERTRNGRRLILHGRDGGGALAAYPVGSLYLTTNNTNPGALFGGTWEAYATGRALVGINPSDTDFATVGQTGGAKTLPAHTHGMAHTHPINHGHTASTNSAGEHTHNAMQNTNINGNVISGGSGAGWSSSAAGGWQLGAGPLGNSGAHTHTVTVANHSGNSGASSAANTGSTGSGSHGVLQPYITIRIWRRTA